MRDPQITIGGVDHEPAEFEVIEHIGGERRHRPGKQGVTANRLHEGDQLEGTVDRGVENLQALGDRVEQLGRCATILDHHDAVRQTDRAVANCRLDERADVERIPFGPGQ